MSKVWSGTIAGPWTAHEELGQGGNGSVYRASCAGNEDEFAIKFLNRLDRVQRFADEAEALRRCQDIVGVIPLVDVNIPTAPSRRNPAWLVMRKAQRLSEAIGPRPSLEAIVAACAEIAATLAAMHERGFSHRDIKPENLFMYARRWTVGDFGLVHFDGKQSLTLDGERIGPQNYLAPEMLNDASNADGRMADVYSLAKVLWKLGTGQTFPAPGELRRTDEAATLSSYLQQGRATLLDPILELATMFEPKKRPSMEVFRTELEHWLRPPPVPHTIDPDLSDLAQAIDAMNQPHYVRARRSAERNEFIQTNGARIREHFRSVASELESCLTAAKLLGVSCEIDNYRWGFSVAGYVLSSAFDGEVNFEARVNFQVFEDGRVELKGVYRAHRESPYSEVILWQSETESFIAHGPGELAAVQQLIANLRAQLRPSAERLLRIARGDEPAR